MRGRKSLPCVASATLAAVLITACGGGSNDNGIAKLSASDALKQVQTAVSNVKTVHVTGTINAQGQNIDLDLRDKAGAGVGTMHVSGGEIDLVRDGDTIYLKGEKDALESFGASSIEATLVAGKWLKESISSGGSFSSIASLLDTKALFDNITSPQGQVKTGETTTVNGQKVATLIDSETDGNGTLYVARTGEPLPVRVDQPGSSGGSLNFEYGVAVNVQAPSGALDVSKLGGG